MLLEYLIILHIIMFSVSLLLLFLYKFTKDYRKNLFLSLLITIVSFLILVFDNTILNIPPSILIGALFGAILLSLCLLHVSIVKNYHPPPLTFVFSMVSGAIIGGLALIFIVPSIIFLTVSLLFFLFLRRLIHHPFLHPVQEQASTKERIENTLFENEQKIRSLQEQLIQSKNELSSNNVRFEDFRKSLRQLEEDNKQLRTQFETLQNTLESKENELGILKNKLNQITEERQQIQNVHAEKDNAPPQTTNKKGPGFVCNECGRSFTTQMSLDQHFDAKHYSISRWFFGARKKKHRPTAKKAKPVFVKDADTRSSIFKPVYIKKGDGDDS